MAELKCAEMKYGVLYVMTHGTVLMLVWPADNLDSLDTVSHIISDGSVLLPVNIST